MLSSSTKRLPLISKQYTLNYGNNNIKATLPYANINLQVTFTGLKLAAMIEDVKCLIKPQKLVGCYNCLSGAELRLNCETDRSEVNALARVTCERNGQKTYFSVLCNNNEEVVRLQLSTAQVGMDCTVSCPAGQTNFTLEGSLDYIPQSTMVEYLRGGTRESAMPNQIDFAALLSFFWGHGFWIALAFAGTIVLSLILFKALLIFKLLSAVFSARPQCRLHDKIV